MLMLSVRFAATIHYYLQAFAPTNLLLRHLRTRGGLKWAIPTALLIVPTYLFAAATTTAVIADGGAGWLNLVALTCKCLDPGRFLSDLESSGCLRSPTTEAENLWAIRGIDDA